MTDLYTNLTLSLLSRYSSVRYTSYDELSDSVADKFWDLAELAYRHLLNFEFVFSNLPDDLIELGFLQSFPRMYSHKDASSCPQLPSSYDTRVSYCSACFKYTVFLLMMTDFYGFLMLIFFLLV